MLRPSPLSDELTQHHQQRIADATGALAVAQTEVEAALKEISVAARADKSIISHRLAVAFEKLTEARAALERLAADKK